MSAIDQLRAMANVEGRASAIQQFRSDFKRMFDVWRARGELSEDEAMQQYNEAAQAVRDHMHDQEWIAAASAHFRQLCIDTERDDERRIRIAAEVGAAKWAAREADMRRRYGGRVPV
jgi:replicative superfamily II helicase